MNDLKIGRRSQNFSKFYSTAKKKYKERKSFCFILFFLEAAKIFKMAFNALRQLATRSPIAMKERIGLLAPSILHSNAMMWRGNVRISR